MTGSSLVSQRSSGRYFKTLSQDYIGYIGLNSDLKIGYYKADPKISDPEDVESDLVIQSDL